MGRGCGSGSAAACASALTFHSGAAVCVAKRRAQCASVGVADGSGGLGVTTAEWERVAPSPCGSCPRPMVLPGTAAGYYNDTIFHRSIKNFMIQVGAGWGGAGEEGGGADGGRECHGLLLLSCLCPCRPPLYVPSPRPARPSPLPPCFCPGAAARREGTPPARARAARACGGPRSRCVRACGGWGWGTWMQQLGEL